MDLSLDVGASGVRLFSVHRAGGWGILPDFSLPTHRTLSGPQINLSLSGALFVFSNLWDLPHLRMCLWPM